MFIYPRLGIGSALELLDQWRGRPLEELRDGSQILHMDSTFYTTGPPVTKRRQREIRDEIRALVDGLGFPGYKPGRAAAVSAFDQQLPGLLHARMEIVPADAASEGVWSFLSLVMLPDVAAWRYPDMDMSRMTGQPRNVFRRLWWRAEVLGPGLEDAPARLGEDQLVSVMERPSIGGDSHLARALCRAVLDRLEAEPGGQGMMLMREAAKRVIRFTPFLALGSLGQADLDALMLEIVGDAAASVEPS
jgi:hypothetical protein